MLGKFITIEGVEGAGKSTALRFMHAYLQKKHKVVVTREPGGTPLAEEIRQVLLHPVSYEPMSSATELLLMFAARAQHIEGLIKPALERGDWVLSDRFVDASYAYQGGGRGLNPEHIAILDQLVVADIYPDLTLLMDIPIEQGLLRTKKRGGQPDRIEKEKAAFFERIRQVYLQRAEQDKKRIKIIDASLSELEVEQQIKTILDEFIAAHPGLQQAGRC